MFCVGHGSFFRFGSDTATFHRSVEFAVRCPRTAADSSDLPCSLILFFFLFHPTCFFLSLVLPSRHVDAGITKWRGLFCPGSDKRLSAEILVRHLLGRWGGGRGLVSLVRFHPFDFRLKISSFFAPIRDPSISDCSVLSD